MDADFGGRGLLCILKIRQNVRSLQTISLQIPAVYLGIGWSVKDRNLTMPGRNQGNLRNMVI
ncbi:MAG: hypothetical protein DMG06_30150 [Acidobacteria bacterium]|nr:MAG: hypothetical protein DMG06_30150 [Acidobacteriota bacterium]